ncbi:hypothetical protein [Streptomyces sp. NBC_01445]|uniref:hypothetical protein n=1 Tax=Streptomyces sp. NBC_01445 TaxID=2903869 RepID=UPI002DDBF1FC|nr:hypothetical protein [Streptomyces sp. NBC_01445]WSE11036.1 hypothetical protein OG574_00200 [Streptomyces sp. NBC_01445]WSE11054.1 hypothetical protein OG574_47810 [Streptomyces sp. NBC_01445]WSE11861.1 hypothetical protein OG574_48210 [Streptomyces sp. NBC_01445]
MDEPTAALTEHRIYQQLKALAVGRATVSIAHCLANTRLTDRIIVVSQGRVCETGTYEELVRRAGNFDHLLKLQEEGK